MIKCILEERETPLASTAALTPTDSDPTRGELMRGKPIVPQPGPETQSPQGPLTPQQLGGRAVLKKYGRDHFVKLGKAGFQKTALLYFDGDRAACWSWLRFGSNY